jgi:hypothetical protein
MMVMMKLLLLFIFVLVIAGGGYMYLRPQLAVQPAKVPTPTETPLIPGEQGEKKLIDDWIIANNLNQYGDPLRIRCMPVVIRYLTRVLGSTLR